MISRFALTVFVSYALAAAGLTVAAQEQRASQSPPELRFSYAPLVDRIAPVVVNVYASKTVVGPQLPFRRSFLPPIFKPTEWNSARTDSAFPWLRCHR